MSFLPQRPRQLHTRERRGKGLTSDLELRRLRLIQRLGIRQQRTLLHLAKAGAHEEEGGDGKREGEEVWSGSYEDLGYFDSGVEVQRWDGRVRGTICTGVDSPASRARKQQVMRRGRRVNRRGVLGSVAHQVDNRGSRWYFLFVWDK